MKALRLHARGDAESLAYEDAPLPRLGPEDALVRVRAAALTPGELAWSASSTTREGRDRLPAVPSHEMSGVVEGVGAAVKDVQAGDAVYGLLDFWRDGAAAEYVAVRAADLASKPASIDHVQAAAVPLSGLTAWQALFDHAALAPGQRVLVHGGAGGVGSLAVQLARWRGARVIATASGADADFVRGLGADEVIDYHAAKFEAMVHDVDVVLATVGDDVLDRSWSVLRPGGVLVALAAPVTAETAARHGARAVFFVVAPDREELVELARLIDGGRLRPVVGAVLPLARAREAYVGGGRDHARGKVVLRVGHRGSSGPDEEGA